MPPHLSKITLSNDAAEIDHLRRAYTLMFVSYIATAIIFVYGIRHIYDQQILLASILICSALAFLLNIVVFHLSGRIDRACLVQSVLVSMFVLVLVYQGGFHNTALYWVYPFPIIQFALLGARRGALLNLSLTVVLALFLKFPEWTIAKYRPEETSRFISSMLTVICVGWISEYFRARSHHKMTALQRDQQTLAYTDSLTGLLNRRYIDVDLPAQLLDNPDDYFPMTVVMLDIDHFKEVNDSFGHDAGDGVLRTVSQLLRTGTRSEDMVARYGGEEFIFFMPHTQLNDGLKRAEFLRQQLAQQAFALGSVARHITASFGVATCHSPSNLKSTIQMADKNLYEAKRAGRNCVR